MRKNSKLLLILTLVVASTLSYAAQPQEPQEIHFVVKKFELVGNNPLSVEETNEAFEYFLGDHYGLEGIQEATAAFEQKLRDSGYSFYKVSLLPQKLQDGVIKLQLNELKIDKVVVTGNNFFSKANLSRNLPTLEAGKTPNTKALSRAINMADAQPSKKLKLQFSENEDGGAINAKLTVVDEKTHFAFLSLNNTGNDETGEFRLTGGYQFTNLFDRDHNLSMSYTTSPDDTSAVQQYGVSYIVPFYEIGGEINFFLARSDVDSGVVAQTLTVSGAGTIALLHYKHTFLQSGAYKQQLDFGIDNKLFENEVNFLGLPTNGTGDVLSRPASLTYIGFWQGAGKTINFNLSHYQNLSGGTHNTDDDYSNLRAGATSDWSLQRLAFGYAHLISSNWFARFNVVVQESSDNLISGEQFGIGGIYSVRGFDERSLLGDKGYQANVELWLPGFSDYEIRPLVFIDYGHVELNTALASEAPSIDISSVGAGLRWNTVNKFNVVLDVAYVTDGANEINAISPDADITDSGDVKGHIDVFYRF